MSERIEGIVRRNQPKRILDAYVVLGLLLVGVLRGQEPPLAEPVPPGLLGDGELVVPARNFAIGTPAGDWQWFVRKGQGEIQSQETYICKETESGAEFQVISTGVPAHFDARFITGVQEGMKESLAARGLRLMSLEMIESATPVPHSYRSQWHALLPDGQPLYGYSYLTASDTVFTIQHITPEAMEPAIFTQFASTFRGLHASSGPRRGSFPWLVGHLLLIGLACLVAAAVNRVCGRAVLNGGRLAAGLIVVVVIVLTAIGAHAGIAADLPPEKLGEIPGRRIGEAFIPLLIAVLVSRAYRKREVRHARLSDRRDDGPSCEAGGN